MVLPPSMQSSLPAGWLAFTGRELNPLDRYKRFQIIHPPFLDLAWRKGSFILNLPFTSFDHLVGAREQRNRRIKIKRLGGFQVDDQLEFGRKLDWEVARPFAFEDAIDVGGRASEEFFGIDAVRRQTAGRDGLTGWINSRQLLASRERDHLRLITRSGRARWHNQPAIRLARECINRLLDLTSLVYDRCRNLYSE